MSKKKTLTAEEKRTKLLELFHETCDVFQLKDLEKLAPKEKGIVMQSVKTTLEQLVDNGDVRTEKIAGSIYFWAFPSQALNHTAALIKEQKQLKEQLQLKIEAGNQQLAAAAKSLEHADAAASLEREIAVLKKEKAELAAEVATSASHVDYEEIEAKERDIKKILEAANRWTDNIFTIKMWCKRKFDKEDRELNKAFGIPEDLEYLDA